MVCNSCVHFLQKFRAIGFSKDDLCTNVEKTKLAVIFGYIKSTTISPVDVLVSQCILYIKGAGFTTDQLHSDAEGPAVKGKLRSQGVVLGTKSHRFVRLENQCPLHFPFLSRGLYSRVKPHSFALSDCGPGSFPSKDMDLIAWVTRTFTSLSTCFCYLDKDTSSGLTQP